jgi:hypothetical protein
MPGIVIPPYIAAIGEGCFEGTQCDTITFEMPRPIPPGQPQTWKLVLGRNCFRQATIREIAIPSWVKVLPSGCFNECARLATVTVRRDAVLETIKKDAFAGTPLTEFVIPAAVTKINGSAFAVNLCEN